MNSSNGGNPEIDLVAQALREAAAGANDYVVWPRAYVRLLALAFLIILLAVGGLIAVINFQSGRLENFQSESQCRSQLAADVDVAAGATLSELGFLVDSIAADNNAGIAIRRAALRDASRDLAVAIAARADTSDICT